jgi:hypothetical protein
MVLEILLMARRAQPYPHHLPSHRCKMAAGSHDFSTLEAVDPTYEPFKDRRSGSKGYFGKPAIPEDEKYAIVYNDGLEAAPNRDLPHTQQFPQQQSRGRRKWILIGGGVLLAVILAALVGGIVGSRRAKTASASTSTQSSGSGVALRQRAIAAVSFASNKINNTRLYYQDDAGKIFEAASSANGALWTTSSVGSAATSNSALAAAVSRPGFPLVIISTF